MTKTDNKKRKQSEAWNHFVLYDDKEGVKRAKCNHCNADYKYTKNTSSLLNHLRSSHKGELSPSSQLLIIDFWKKRNKGACFDLAELVCVQGYSFRSIFKCRIIKNYIFQKHGVKLDSPNTIKEYVMCFGRYVIYKQREYILNLKKQSPKFCLIINEVKSVENKKILGLKLKIIDEFIIDLGIIKINNRSTEEKILSCIEIKLNVYGIELDDIVVLVSDANSKISSVCRLMDVFHQTCYSQLIESSIKEEIYKEASFFKSNSGALIDDFSNDSYLDNNCLNDEISNDEDTGDGYHKFINSPYEISTCIDYTDCNITVDLKESRNIKQGDVEDDDLILNIFNINYSDYNELELNQDYKDVIHDVRRILSWFKLSTTRLNALNKYSNRFLILDIPNKWKSLYNMINLFLELLPHFKKAFSDLNQEDLTKNVNLNKLKTIKSSLEILNDATNELSKNDCTFETAIHILEFSIELLSKDSSTLSQRLKQNLEEGKKRSHETAHYYIYKTLADPNYNFDKDDSFTESILIESMTNLYKKINQLPESSSTEPVESEPVESEFNDFFSTFLESPENPSFNKNDLKNQIKSDLDQLKKNGSLSDKLMKILDFIRQLPVNSVIDERLLSISDFIHHKYRKEFDGTMLNCVLILKSYFEQENLIFHENPKHPY